MDSKLYTRLKPQEIQQEIDSYNASNSSRPPLVILKKIILNLTIGNLQLVEWNGIFTFTCRIILKFSTNEGVKKLGMLIVEMYVSLVYRNSKKSSKNDKDGSDKNGTQFNDLDVELEGILPYLIEQAGSDPPNINALHILGSADVGCMSLQLLKTYTNSLWILVNEKLSCDDEKGLHVEFVHASVRLVQKIMKTEFNKELREDKIKVIFNKLMNILNKFSDISVISAVAGTMLDLTMVDNKYPFLKINLTMSHVSKLITIITHLRSHSSTGELLSVKHYSQLPSLLTLLTKFEITYSNRDICKDLVTCVKPFMNDYDVAVVMNSIKCVIYFLNETNDPAFNSQITIDVIQSFNKLFAFDNNRIVKEDRTTFFNCLRNLILIVIKYGKDVKENNNEIFQRLITNFINIDEEIDVEPYIIDTKLEILYLLSIEGIEDKLIIDILLPLVKSSNADISYKATRTIGNLIVKEKKYMNIMNTMIERISTRKNLLAISIFIKDLAIINDNYDTKIVAKYIDRVCRSRDDIYDMISEGNFKDEDVISYIWVLGEFGDVEELIRLKQGVWDRNRLSHVDEEIHLKEMQIFVMDMYLTSLIKSWIRTGRESEKVLKIMNESSKASKHLARRVKFYLQVILSCNGDKDKLQSVILLRESADELKNSRELDDGGLGLSDDTVSELCGVFGSLACVYLRGVHSVFRNG